MKFTDHLFDRGLRPYHKHWHTGELPNSPDEEHVVFPLTTPDGKVVGHQRYFWHRPKLRNNGEQGRYITTFLHEYKLTTCYGFTNCFGHGPLFITEGIWDAIRVSNCYVDCVAILCSHPSPQLRSFLRLYANGRKIVGLCDEDGKLGKGWCDHVYFPANGYADFNAMPHNICFERLTAILKECR